MNPSPTLANGSALPIRDLPRTGPEELNATLLGAAADGARIAALFGVPEDALGTPDAPADSIRLIALVADDFAHALRPLSATVSGRFESLTPQLPQAHRFEREIYEQWGVEPVGHPWLKPVRFQDPARPRPGQRTRAEQIGLGDFFRVAGREVHEVAVGPVHAGIIEPGHFRFQCHGEDVYHLEIALGYQHRGVERALVGGPGPRTRHVIATLAGDTTVGHSLAYAQVVESLSRTSVSSPARRLRGVALELERLANHVGDLGAIAGDIGFLPTSAFCGGLRGDFLNLTALLCGNRFGRDLVAPGGTLFAVDDALGATISERAGALRDPVTRAVELLWNTPLVMTRLVGTGPVSQELARQMGFVGVAARATGLARDVRHDFPSDEAVSKDIPVATAESGDVHARALVRWQEIQASLDFVVAQAAHLPQGPTLTQVGPLRPEHLAVSLVEGWRGELCHVALTNAAGRFALYKVIDPSFHNWAALAHAMRDQPISDFPLCNKSFSLSYCGQDL
jgi:Ni,Fe-hydrogenase III large subunit